MTILARFPTLLLVSLLILTGCDTSTSDDPVIFVKNDDAEMAAAEQEALDTVNEFIVALQNPKPGQTSFAVKAKFTDRDNVEYMWIGDLKYADGKFVGTLANDPQHLDNIKLGDQTSVAANKINDWMILKNEEMIGGFTVKVLTKRQEQAK